MHCLIFALAALAHTEPAAFRGALTSDAPVRLQRAAAYFQADDAGADLSESPVESLTREQLQREYLRLERARPTVGGPIALTAVGGGLLLGGLFCVVIAFSTFLYTGTNAALGYAIYGYLFLITGAALVVTGGVLLTIGLIRLFNRIGQRRAFTQRMDDVNLRLETLDQANPPATPVQPDVPPPANPQPGAGFFDVHPTYVMATF